MKRNLNLAWFLILNLLTWTVPWTWSPNQIRRKAYPQIFWIKGVMGKIPFINPFIRWGLVSLTILLLIFLPPIIGSGITTATDSLLGDKHQAKGLQCDACHKEDPPKKSVSNEICLTCHGDQGKLADKTNKVVPNPHASPHLDPGTPLACDECHHIHKPSKTSCLQCHQEFKLRNL